MDKFILHIHASEGGFSRGGVEKMLEKYGPISDLRVSDKCFALVEIPLKNVEAAIKELNNTKDGERTIFVSKTEKMKALNNKHKF